MKIIPLPGKWLVSHRLIALLFVSACLSQVHANPVQSPEFFHSQIESSEEIEQAAARWKITPEDYRRYQTLIKGPVSLWNAAMDPIMVLGLFAESESEQQRFAELYAMQEHDLTTRTLAFERAYRRAFSTLFPDAQVLDKQLLQPYYAARQKKSASTSMFDTPQAVEIAVLKQGDRLLYFPINNCLVCGQTVARLQDTLSRTSIVLDIYIREASSKEDVRHWAATNDVAIETVNEGLVTLNLDNGLYQRLLAKAPSTLSSPSFFLLRDSRLFSVDERAIGL